MVQWVILSTFDRYSLFLIHYLGLNMAAHSIFNHFPIPIFRLTSFLNNNGKNNNGIFQ